MARLAVYAAHFETMRTHASYDVEGELETLDRHGKTDSVKSMKATVQADGKNVKFIVEKYIEDGEDRTEDAREKALRRFTRPRKDKPKLRMPILAEQQPRYVFDQIAVDPRDPSRVEIAFSPKTPDDDTLEGSAWVDTRTGTLISAGFKLSRPPVFVGYVHFVVEFGATSAIGPAPSTVAVEGEGGFLFFRKRFRGMATLSGYRIAR